MRRFAALLLLTPLLACDADRRTTAPDMERRATTGLSDATTDGHEDFMVLPPLVKGAPAPTAPFNPHLDTKVEVCLYDVTGAACAGDTVLFTTEDGTVQVSLADEHYKALWKPADAAVGDIYRLRFSVWDGEAAAWVPVGFADVTFTDKGPKNRSTEDAITLNPDQSVAIHWRLQSGAACESGSDCFKGTVTNEGGVFPVGSGYAVLDAPAGWLPVDQELTLVIERIDPTLTGGECVIEFPLPQAEGCYSVDLYNADGSLAGDQNGTFVFSATAQPIFAMCPEPNLPDNYAMHQQHNDGRVERPQEVFYALDCTDFTPLYSPQVSFGVELLERMTGPLARILSPKPLYAKDGLGGMLSELSDFFYAPAVQIGQPLSEPAATQLAGAQVQLTLPIVIAHGSSGLISGIPVELEVAGGNGAAVSPATAVSDANGNVDVVFTLGDIAGSYTLTARIAGLDLVAGATAPEYTFTATVAEGGTFVLSAPYSATVICNDAALCGTTTMISASWSGHQSVQPAGPVTFYFRDGNGNEVSLGGPTQAMSSIDSEDNVGASYSLELNAAALPSTGGQMAPQVDVPIYAKLGTLTTTENTNLTVLGGSVGNTFVISSPTAPVAVCNDSVYCQSTSTVIRASDSGSTGYVTPIAAVRFYRETAAGTLVLIGTSTVPTVVDGASTRTYSWQVTLDADGLDSQSGVPIFAVGMLSSGAPGPLTSDNTNVSIVAPII